MSGAAFYVVLGLAAVALVVGLVLTVRDASAVARGDRKPPWLDGGDEDR